MKKEKFGLAIWIIFVIVGTKTLLKAIILNETWRIIASGIGFLIAVFFCVTLISRLRNNRRTS